MIIALRAVKWMKCIPSARTIEGEKQSIYANVYIVVVYIVMTSDTQGMVVGLARISPIYTIPIQCIIQEH
jgi:hypothetical protein